MTTSICTHLNIGRLEVQFSNGIIENVQDDQTPLEECVVSVCYIFHASVVCYEENNNPLASWDSVHLVLYEEVDHRYDRTKESWDGVPPNAN